MLKRDYKSLVVGKNYLSYFLSFLLLKRGEGPLLLIDDDDVKYGDNWHCSLSELEVNLIQTLGDEFNISAFSNIKKCLRYKQYSIVLGKKTIALGRTPYQNLTELLRKLPDCFSEELFQYLQKNNEDEFNRQVDIFIHVLVNEYLYSRKGQVALASVFENVDGPVLKEFFKSFSGAYAKASKRKENNLNAKHLIFVLQGKFQSLFKDQYDEIEMNYLLTSALSPHYELDEEALNEQLTRQLFEQDGEMKNTSIQYWQFYRQRLTSILLSSYEGVVHPKKTYYMGNLLPSLPFYLDNPRRVLSNLVLNVDSKKEIFGLLEGKSLIFSPQSRLGSDFPMWELNFKNANKCSVRYLFPHLDGTKPRFYADQSIKDVLSSFRSLFGELGEDEFDWHFKEGANRWTENYQQKKYFPIMFDIKKLEGDEKIKDFNYWGPLQAHKLGLFGCLREIRNSYLS